MSRKARTGIVAAEGVQTPPDEKNRAGEAQDAAESPTAKNTAVIVDLTVAKKWRCPNPGLVVCEDAAGTQCLLRVPQRSRDNFRPHLANGEPMVVRATLVAGNLYTLAGRAPRWPGRW